MDLRESFETTGGDLLYNYIYQRKTTGLTLTRFPVNFRRISSCFSPNFNRISLDFRWKIKNYVEISRSL